MAAPATTNDTGHGNTQNNNNDVNGGSLLTPVLVTLPSGGETTEPDVNAAIANPNVDDDDESCLFCGNVSTKSMATALSVASVSSIVVAATSGSSGPAAAALMSALSHSAMMAKLDVMAVRSPSFVDVNDAFSIFNFQGLPVPWSNEDSNISNSSSTLTPWRLSANSSTTLFANSSSDCYDASNSVNDARQIQKLANIRNVAAKVALVDSNVFYVAVAFACVTVVQFLLYILLRFMVRQRVKTYQRRLARLTNFARSIKNANRLRNESSESKPGAQSAVVGESPPRRRKQVPPCRSCSLRLVEALLSLVLLRKDASTLSSEQGPKRSSFRAVMDVFVIKDEKRLESAAVKGTAHMYVVTLLAVYQGVCESCAFVLSVESLSENVSVGSTAASLAAFVVIVVVGFIAVWAVLLAFVRPQRLTLYEDEKDKWVGTDAHGVLLQNAGSLFKNYRYGAGRYLFTGVWMTNLMCLAFILAFATGETQLYLMIANEAWFALALFVWQPYRLRTPVFGGRGHINKNALHGCERLLMIAVLSLAAFYPVEACESLPEWVTSLMIALAVIPAIVPLVLLVGTFAVWANRRCSRAHRAKREPVLAATPRKANQVAPVFVAGTSKTSSPASPVGQKMQATSQQRVSIEPIKATEGMSAAKAGQRATSSAVVAATAAKSRRKRVPRRLFSRRSKGPSSAVASNSMPATQQALTHEEQSVAPVTADVKIVVAANKRRRSRKRRQVQKLAAVQLGEMDSVEV